MAADLECKSFCYKCGEVKDDIASMKITTFEKKMKDYIAVISPKTPNISRSCQRHDAPDLLQTN